MNFTFFSSAHGTFSRVDNILGHKSSLGKLKKNWNHFKHLIWSQCSKIRCQIQEHTHTHTEHIHTCSFTNRNILIHSVTHMGIPISTWSHTQMLTHSNHAHILMRSYTCILLHVMICTNHMSSLMPIFIYTCANVSAFSHTHVPAIPLEYAYKFTKTNLCSYAYIHTFTDTAAKLLSHLSPVPFCDPRDGSPPGSTVPGILQVRTLE